MTFLCPLTLFLPSDQLHVEVLMSIFKEKNRGAFPYSSIGKESVCNAGDLGLTLGWEDPLEKGRATNSSILAWRIPWTV